MAFYFQVEGKVQGVMFRYTVVSAASRFGLNVGATNDSSRFDRVLLTFESNNLNVVLSFLNHLKNTIPLNSLGAHVKSYCESEHLIKIEDHQYNSAKIKTIQLSKLPLFFV